MPVSLHSELMVDPTLNVANDFCVQSNTLNICKRTFICGIIVLISPLNWDLVYSNTSK